jgi:hypothetical protein
MWWCEDIRGWMSTLFLDAAWLVIACLLKKCCTTFRFHLSITKHFYSAPCILMPHSHKPANIKCIRFRFTWGGLHTFWLIGLWLVLSSRQEYKKGTGTHRSLHSLAPPTTSQQENKEGTGTHRSPRPAWAASAQALRHATPLFQAHSTPRWQHWGCTCKLRKV